MQKVYLLVGAPGSGKTWVGEQLKNKFTYVAHDDYMGGGYVDALMKAARVSTRPVLGETPFSLSRIIEPLEKARIDVQPVFILESPHTTKTRYEKREGKRIPQGHLTRIETYRKRAKEYSAPSGTSAEVLDYLRQL